MTPAHRLRELAAHPSKRVRAAVAESPRIEDSLVIDLAADVDEMVRVTAASNAAARPLVERDLAASPDKWVRAVLAHTYAYKIEQLQRQTQEVLVCDEFPETRMRIAETTSHRDLFDVLLEDDRPEVRGACAGNPRAHRTDVDRLLADPSWKTRAAAVTSGLNYPDREQLIRVATDRSAEVRWQVLFRAGAPLEVAGLLATDDDEMVRDRAQAVLDGNPTWEREGETDEIARRKAMAHWEFEPQ